MEFRSYTRKVAGSPILEYKSNAIIDAPILKVITLFEDEKKIRRWYYQCVRSELVENETPKQESYLFGLAFYLGRLLLVILCLDVPGPTCLIRVLVIL